MAKESDDDSLAPQSGEGKTQEESSGSDRQEKGEDDNKRSESQAGQDQSPVGFWHPALNDTRLQIFKAWGITIWVVDFDAQVAPYTDITPIVGPQIVKAAEQLVAPSGTVGWGSLPASQFNYDPMEVRRQIYNFKAWAAVIVNPNATALLQDAVQNGNSSYDPLGAAQIVYVEARDDQTVDYYIVPQLFEFTQLATNMVGKVWTTQVLSQASSNTTLLSNLSRAPQALNPAIGFSTFNLRPFFPPTATPSVSIGLIYLIIIAFFSYTFYLPHHMKFITIPGRRHLKFHQLIIWRWVSTVAAYFFLSLAYSIISLAFQIPFSAPPGSETELVQPATAYGKGSFVVYWMVNWIGMVSLGLACENVAMVAGMPWTSLWLIFWVITNVSTSFYDVDLAPKFYTWGYVWPLHNIVEASRSILFDLHSRIGLNLGVLFAWCAVNTTLFPFACFFQRWQTMRQKKKAGAGEKKGN